MKESTEENTTSATTEKWSVEIDEELCSGCATCTAYDPIHFKIGEAGISEFQNDVPISNFEPILDAARNCPSRAIIAKDNQAGEVVS